MVNQPEWWTRASVQDIADVHETATGWRDHDDTAAAAHDTIRREVRDRYGVDVDWPGADPAAVAQALWAAGGTPHTVFPLTYDELVLLTGGTIARVD